MIFGLHARETSSEASPEHAAAGGALPPTSPFASPAFLLLVFFTRSEMRRVALEGDEIFRVIE